MDEATDRRRFHWSRRRDPDVEEVRARLREVTAEEPSGVAAVFRDGHLELDFRGDEGYRARFVSDD